MATTGALWIAVAAANLTQPQHWVPVAALDYAAMALFSAGMIGLSLSVALLPTSGAARTAARIVSGAAATNGIANLLEDGVGLKEFGGLWVASILVLYLALIAFAVLSFRGAMRTIATVAAFSLIGLMLITYGGAALTGATWIVFALAPLARRSAGSRGERDPSYRKTM